MPTVRAPYSEGVLANRLSGYTPLIIDYRRGDLAWRGYYGRRNTVIISGYVRTTQDYTSGIGLAYAVGVGKASPANN